MKTVRASTSQIDVLTGLGTEVPQIFGEVCVTEQGVSHHCALGELKSQRFRHPVRHSVTSAQSRQ